MRATGQIGGDGTTINIAIDNRRKVEAMLANLTEGELRALARGDVIDQPALSRPIDVEVTAG